MPVASRRCRMVFMASLGKKEEEPLIVADKTLMFVCCCHCEEAHRADAAIQCLKGSHGGAKTRRKRRKGGGWRNWIAASLRSSQ